MDINTSDYQGTCSKLCASCPNPFSYEEDYYKEDDNYFTCQFRKDKMHLFLMKDKDKFFTNAERSRIVFEVLMRTNFSDDCKASLGIRRLINTGVYEGAYPLHDGPYVCSQGLALEDPNMNNERRLLYELWARPKRWYKFQPLDLVRGYFGEKIAIYFTWLGLYTQMLIPVSIIGILCFIYGIATIMDYTPANDICNKTWVGNITLCPQCDRACSYLKLSQSCLYSRISYLFDNPATIFFAIIMSIWGTLFLELWKRREAQLQYDWDVATYEEEEAVRPEYEVQCQYVRLNPVTGLEEPYLPSYIKCPKYFLSVGLVFFMVSLVICCVVGVIVYRVVMNAVFYSFDVSYVKSYAKILTSITAACINLVVILILGRIYRILAIYLTNFELPRTATDYDNNLTLKMYCFQFFNFYASLFYIAFFKGSFVGRPGKYDYSLIYRQEQCDPSGCLIELCIQMLIIFLGKQLINNFMELLLPMIFNCLRMRQMKKARENQGEVEEEDPSNNLSVPQWERDYPLVTIDHLTMFDEYLEMVIQFGFVTIFVSAMPLAPLFALINNVIEIRLDAYKMVTQWRRPFASRAQDIGIWYDILKVVAIFSILTNALIIGYTSDAIPRLVYRYAYSPNDSLDGYVQFSLSLFKTADFENRSIPDVIPSKFGPTVDYCWYRGFREPPTSPEKYEYSRTFWHVFTARFVFIVIFEHLVLVLTTVLAWMIPDMPEKLKVQMRRERYLAQEVMFKAEEETLKQTLRQRTPRNITSESDSV